MDRFKVGFIGAGNIASAIFGGIVNSGYIKSDEVCVFDLDSSKTSEFELRGATVMATALELASDCDFIFLTVKPQVYEIVLNEIKSALKASSCLIDVAAGITVSFVKSIVGSDIPVVRVMPNTPLMYGKGSSALVKEESVSEEQFDFVRGCFDSCGVTVLVDEKHINTVTAVSGSAPAYVMRFMKDFIDFAVSQGMNASDAEKLILMVFSGTAEMVSSDQRSVAELIAAVTSPNGTTQAGLASLDNDSFDDIVAACLDATLRRAVELSK